MDSCFNPEMNIRSQIEKMISDVFESLETEYWDEPIIGIAAGDDSYYDFLRTIEKRKIVLDPQGDSSKQDSRRQRLRRTCKSRKACFPVKTGSLRGANGKL